MPTTTSSRSRPSAAESGQTHLPLPSTTKFELKTPERKPNATRPVADPTPIALGTSILQKLQLDTDEDQTYDINKYEQFITQDFDRHRVFVDIDVFMKHVLHVPDNWRALWGRTIRGIKRNGAFSTAHWDYHRQCAIWGVKESNFYQPLVAMGNAILDISKKSEDSVKPQTPQIYLRNDPKRVLCGVMPNLSPDIVAVHDGFLPHIRSGERDGRCLVQSNLTWAQPLQALEVKPWDGALIDGSCMPRLKVKGRDPQKNHARPHEPSRARERKVAISTPTFGEVASAPDLPLSRKRPGDELLEPNRKIGKTHHRSTPGGARSRASGKKLGKPQAKETDCQKSAHLQVGRYLLEQFSVPAFRSHVTIGLVDRDRIQFYHANHSVILVSSAINFSMCDRTGGVDKFIAIVIAFSRLSLRDNGILHDLHDGKLFRDNGKLPTSKLAHGAVRIQEGNKLEFGGDENTQPFTLTYGEVISHEPSLAGRSTAVLHAKSPKWKDTDLVVKISWPGSERIPENVFLDKAIEKAEEDTAEKWARDHLPRVLFAQDVVFDSDSTHEKVASLFDNAEFVDEEYNYERRTLRIIIQERLYPLKTLTNVKDIAQVLLDVACIHRWLFERAKILHRDLSLNNIMYRIIKGKVYGVLSDYDLSSWTASLTSDYTKTSQQRTGTPPFMASGLLDGTDAVHLYRHDVESLFYIMLILATHYEIQAPKKGEDGGIRTREGLKTLPYQEWFDQPSYKALAFFKQGFFSNLSHLNLSPTFEDFRDWLGALRLAFRRGVRAKQTHEEDLMFLPQQQDEGSEDEDIPTFDDETLAGHVTYSALLGPVRNPKGKLNGLRIRYDPKSTPPPTSTGATQTDA